MDKRTGLAMVLCFLILIGWMWISPKIFPPAASPPAPPPAPATPVAPPPPKPPPEVKAPPVATAPAAHYPVRDPILLKSKYLDVLLTNEGAGIRMLTLHYPKSRPSGDVADDPANLVPILGSAHSSAVHLALRHVGGSDAIESLPWEVGEVKADRVEFRYRLRNGVEITKEFSIDPVRHTLGMTVMLDNRNAPEPGKKEPAEVLMELELIAVDGIDPDSFYRYEQYLNGIWSYDRSLPQLKSLSEVQKGESKVADEVRGGAREDSAPVKAIKEKYMRVLGARTDWFGIKNRFFTAVVLPDSAALEVHNYCEFRTSSPEVAKATDGHPNLTAVARSNVFGVRGGRRVFQYTMYAGPIETDALADAPALKPLGEYSGGCFLAPVIKPAASFILELLHLSSRLFGGNLGIGIIVTTLVIRLCMFPLSLKSQRNAVQMQALAPKIQALKERYKDDQQKYGVEQMRLFKENKVNPVAGCLPVFIQMPIFIGMYYVFEMSIELRHAAFFGWIKDLSEPDRLMGPWNPIVIPLIITQLRIDALNLLPILMTVTWFLQSYLSPRSPDPQTAQQQKMMTWMPVVFGLTCYGLASGLSLYFLANSMLSMAEQKVIKRYILKIDSHGKPLPPKESRS